MPSQETPYDVIVVGAGPIGLFLACELAMREVSVLLLEKDKSPASQWKCGLHGKRGLYGVPVVDALYRRGMLEPIFDGHETPPHCESVPSMGMHFTSHFAGTRLEVKKADLSRWKHRLPLATEFHLPAPIYLNELEDMLYARYESLGGQIKRGVAVTSLEQQDEVVRLQTQGGEEYTCRWLVGCDGEHSIVREKANIDFVGTGPQFVNYVAECDLADPDCLGEGLKAGYITPSPGVIFAMDFTLDQPDSRCVTREQFEKVMRRVTGRDIVVEHLRTCTATANPLRHATRYRQGRILLAGASAHHHPSIGGAQAMTVGLEDAVNLGWKLAYTVRGVAQSTLLDTYEDERLPYALEVLELARVQIAANRPSPEGRAIKSVVRQFTSSPENTTLLLEQAIGLGRRHDLGGAHPLLGYNAPDFTTSDGQRLGKVLQRGNFVLVYFEPDGSGSVFESARLPSSSLLTCVTSNSQDSFGMRGMLVRPDGIICWATDESFNVEQVGASLADYIDIKKAGTLS